MISVAQYAPPCSLTIPGGEFIWKDDGKQLFQDRVAGCTAYHEVHQLLAQSNKGRGKGHRTELRPRAAHRFVTLPEDSAEPPEAVGFDEPRAAAMGEICSMTGCSRWGRDEDVVSSKGSVSSWIHFVRNSNAPHVGRGNELPGWAGDCRRPRRGDALRVLVRIGRARLQTLPSSSTSTNPGSVPPAMSKFTPSPQEVALVNQIFAQADTQKIGVVTGDAAVKIFGGTKLPPTILAEVWNLADEDNKGVLTRKDVAVAVRLLGHAQRGERITEAHIHQRKSRAPAFRSLTSPLIPDVSKRDPLRLLKALMRPSPANGPARRQPSHHHRVQLLASRRSLPLIKPSSRNCFTAAAPQMAFSVVCTRTALAASVVPDCTLCRRQSAGSVRKVQVASRQTLSNLVSSPRHNSVRASD